MSPRFKPPTLQELGIEAVFERRKLNLELFKLAVSANQDNTAIANILSKDYEKRYGIPIHIAAKTIKSYKTLL